MNSTVTLTQNKVLMERHIKTLLWDIVQFSTDRSLFILPLSAGPITNKFIVWKAEEPEKSHMVQMIARVVSRLRDWLITLKKISDVSHIADVHKMSSKLILFFKVKDTWKKSRQHFQATLNTLR